MFEEVEESFLHHVGDLIPLERGPHQHHGPHRGYHVVGGRGLLLLEEDLLLLLGGGGSERVLTRPTVPERLIVVGCGRGR